MSTGFDRRLTPARPDLAAEHLRGKVEAPRYVEGTQEEIIAEVADMRASPSTESGLDTQAIRGERVTIYEIEEGWAWGQLARDSYVGFLPAAALKPAANAPTHRVNVLRTFLYPGPSMKLPIEQALPLNAEVCVTEMAGDFARLGEEGFVWSSHLAPKDMFAKDFVSIAEQFVGVPYLWGGKTALGLDCSGLVQTSLWAAGIFAPRDTDMQEKALGESLALGDLNSLRRGDLIFWKGHVGIMRDSRTLLHANGHHMLVASEPLSEALARIEAKSFGRITSIKRLAALAA
jgi:cell wall-associated NlpC family hydrolase